MSRHSPVAAERVRTSRLTRITARMWPSHSVSAKLSPGANTSTVTGFVAGPALLVGGLGAIERCGGVAQRGDGVMQGGLVGFDLGDQMNAAWRRLARMLFLTMHGIDGDHGAGQRKRAKQGLHGRYFIGLFVAVEMRQHQSRVGSKGAEHVRGATVEKVVEASPQGLAIDRHMTLAFDRSARRSTRRHGGETQLRPKRRRVAAGCHGSSCRPELSATSRRTRRAAGRGEHR